MIWPLPRDLAFTSFRCVSVSQVSQRTTQIAPPPRQPCPRPRARSPDGSPSITSLVPSSGFISELVSVVHYGFFNISDWTSARHFCNGRRQDAFSRQEFLTDRGSAAVRGCSTCCAESSRRGNLWWTVERQVGHPVAQSGVRRAVGSRAVPLPLPCGEISSWRLGCHMTQPVNTRRFGTTIGRHNPNVAGSAVSYGHNSR